METTAWKALTVAGCVLVSGVVTGCTTTSDATPTSPKPSATATTEGPTAKKRREQFEAASKVYQQGERVAYDIAIAGGSSKKEATKKLRPYMSGDYLKAYIEQAAFFKAEKLRIEGQPTMRVLPGGSAETLQELTACVDVSSANTLDSKGKSIDPPENKVQIVRVKMRLTKDGKWKSDDADVTFAESFKNTVCKTGDDA